MLVSAYSAYSQGPAYKLKLRDESVVPEYSGESGFRIRSICD